MKKLEKLPSKEINKAVRVLKKGGVIIFPTDTVYGIGCKYDNKESADRIRIIKKSSQNLPILVSSINQAKTLGNVNQQAQKLMEKHWPGGLTMVIKSRNNSTIGVRMPNSPIVLSIIDALGSPIIGTSANFHGKTPPGLAQDLDNDLIKLVDYVVQGKCRGMIESTVVDTTVSPPKILRQGAVTL